MIKRTLVVVSFWAMAFTSIAQGNIYGHYEYKTECLNIEQDGSQTVMAWGQGRNRLDAVAQAKKNALYDVIFNGIRDGAGGCDVRPLVPTVNARRVYEDFFNKFFSDGGAFQKYVTVQDERIDQKLIRNRARTRNDVTNGFVLRVLRPALKEYFQQEMIIK